MEAIMRPPRSRQPDLFEVESKTSDIPSTQKTLVVSLIERLLIEALADENSPAPATDDKTREAAHEQDHA